MKSHDIQDVKRFTTGALTTSKAVSQAAMVEAVLAKHQRNGGNDMTVNEVCRAYIAAYTDPVTGLPPVMHPSTANARLHGLEAAERVLCDRENKRMCTVTGKTVKVYSLPLKQAGLI